MFEFLKTLRGWVSPRPSQPTFAVAVAGLVNDPVSHAVPVYPPSDPGIPAADLAHVLKTQDELTYKIIQAATLDEFGHKHLPVLLSNYAAYVHLLPATKAEQYPSVGGLYRLGLDLAYNAIRSSHGVIFATEIAEVRVKSIPRWRTAMLCAGLLSDVFRIVASMRVTIANGETWNPFFESLADFLVRNRADRYFVKWEKTHEQQKLNPVLAARIIPSELLGYLSEGGPHIVSAMLDAIAGSGDSPLAAGINRVRDNTIRKDVSSNPNFIGRPVVGSHIESHLLDVMRRLLRTGTWKVNADNQPLWYATDGLYLVGQSAWKEMYAALLSAGYSGIPTDLNSVAEILSKAGVIDKTDEGDYLHEIKTSYKKPMMAFRLSTPARVFGDAWLSPEPLLTPLQVRATAATSSLPSPKPSEHEVDDALSDAQGIAQSIFNAPKSAENTVLSEPSIEDDLGFSLDDLTGGAPVSASSETMDFDTEEAPAAPQKSVSKHSGQVDAGQGGAMGEGWQRLKARLKADMADWLENVVLVATEEELEADAAILDASLLDEAPGGRPAAISQLSKLGALYVPPGQTKKLIDLEDGGMAFGINKLFLEGLK